METKQSLKPLRHNTFEVYNFNNELKYVNPLSDNNEPHTGVILIKNQGDFEKISMVRLRFLINHFDFILRPFYMMGQRVNISRYFSAYQLREGIIDIPITCKLSELDLKIPLKKGDNCKVSIFELDEAETTTGNEWIPPYNQNESYVVLNNDSIESKLVNLIDLIQNRNIPEGIIIENHYSNIKPGEKLKTVMIRIFSECMHQRDSIIKVGYGDNLLDEIHTEKYYSAYANHEYITEVPYEMELFDEQKVMVHIGSNKKVMYHFFHSMPQNLKDGGITSSMQLRKLH